MTTSVSSHGGAREGRKRETAKLNEQVRASCAPVCVDFSIQCGFVKRFLDTLPGVVECIRSQGWRQLDPGVRVVLRARCALPCVSFEGIRAKNVY